MFRSIFYFLLLAVALCALIPFVPLHMAVDLLQLRRIGFEATVIEGNIWEGNMYEVKLGPIQMGDVHSKLSLDELSSGRVRLDLTGSEEATAGLKGGFSFGWGGLGIDKFNLAMPVMAGPPPIGGVTLIVDDLTVRFPSAKCADGRGEIRAYLSGALPMVGLPGEMSGPALCRDGKLTFDLESPDGRATEEVTILSIDRYKIRMFIKPRSPEIGELLQSKGFRPFLDGYTFAEERSLGGEATAVPGDGTAEDDTETSAL